MKLEPANEAAESVSVSTGNYAEIISWGGDVFGAGNFLGGRRFLDFFRVRGFFWDGGFFWGRGIF